MKRLFIIGLIVGLTLSGCNVRKSENPLTPSTVATVETVAVEEAVVAETTAEPSPAPVVVPPVGKENCDNTPPGGEAKYTWKANGAIEITEVANCPAPFLLGIFYMPVPYESGDLLSQVLVSLTDIHLNPGETKTLVPSKLPTCGKYQADVWRGLSTEIVERNKVDLQPGRSTTHVHAYTFGDTGVACATPVPSSVASACPYTSPGSDNFCVLGGSTVTNTGSSVLSSDLGVSPGAAVVGFPPGLVLGAIHAADAVALAGQNAAVIQYNALGSPACTLDLTGQDLGGKILTPGVYCFSTSAQLTGPLTLNAQGNPAAAFIFRVGSALTTASASSVVLINGASPCSVFWQIGSSATLGSSTAFKGTIVAMQSITLNTGVTLIGRAKARNGAVTLDTNVITAPTCSVCP